MCAVDHKLRSERKKDTRVHVSEQFVWHVVDGRRERINYDGRTGKLVITTLNGCVCLCGGKEVGF